MSSESLIDDKDGKKLIKLRVQARITQEAMDNFLADCLKRRRDAHYVVSELIEERYGRTKSN